jgi:hypothetical protein
MLKNRFVVGVAFYSRIKKTFRKLNYRDEQGLSEIKESTKNVQANRHRCFPATALGILSKKISHNLIPQQCKPKHFPATKCDFEDLFW